MKAQFINSNEVNYQNSQQYNNKSNHPFKELNCTTKNNADNDNNYRLFSKEWEWEQCCYHYVE